MSSPNILSFILQGGVRKFEIWHRFLTVRCSGFEPEQQIVIYNKLGDRRWWFCVLPGAVLRGEWTQLNHISAVRM